MDNKPANFNEYLRDQLKHRNYAVIASEARRNGVEGLIPRADLHSSEIAREQKLLSLISRTDKFCCVAIDPDTGLFGVLQVFRPDGELRFDDDEIGAAPTSSESSAVARERARKLLVAGKAAGSIAQKILSSEIKDYESLIAHLPSDVDSDLALQCLKHSKGRPMEIETTEGTFAIGGFDKLVDTLPCKETYTLLVDVQGMERSKKHDSTISFAPVDDQPVGCALPLRFKNHVSITSEIATSNKRASFKFIHFACAQEQYVKLKLQMDYAISTGRWTIKVVDILDSADVIANAQSPQMMFKDW